MHLLGLIGALAMTAPTASTAAVQTQNIMNVTPLLMNNNDGYGKQLKWLSSEEVYRQKRVKEIYGSEYPVFTNLKKPNTWENFWYDFLVVNGLKTTASTDQLMKLGLDQIRTFMGINDEQISNRYGDLVHGRPQVVDNSMKKLTSFTFRNGSNLNQTYLTDEFTQKVTSTERWNINAGFSMKYSASASIKFFGASASASTSYSFNANTTHEQQITVEETLRSPSQTIILEPQTMTTLDWFLSDSLFKVNGGIRYKANEHFSKDLTTQEKNFFLIPTDLGGGVLGGYRFISPARSLWLIANAGTNKYFTEESNDLFIIDGVSEWAEQYNSAWNTLFKGGKAVSYTYNIPVQYYMHGLNVEYNITTKPL